MLRMLIITSLLLTGGLVMAQNDGFTDHGICAAVAESRGVVVTHTASGKNLAITCATDCSPRGYILVTDLDSGETQQLFYPEGVANSDPFASLMSRNGRFYTGAGPAFLEFDPDSGKWLFAKVINPKASCYVGSAITDGPGELIWKGTYPDCRLYSYDPQTQEVVDYGQMDEEEHYFSYLVFDSAGWAYAGIGTARQNIVAFNPQTRERKQMVDEAERVVGTGYVYTGVDGKVYGRAGNQWYRLFAGEREAIPEAEKAGAAPSGSIGWGQNSGTLPDGRRVSVNLPDSRLEITDPKAGETRRIDLKYEGGGVSLTSMAQGPDGNIYASTCHPMHLAVYDPAAEKLEDWGPVYRVGGGNFCHMSTQGQYLVAASYSHGIFHVYDSTRPFNGGYGKDPNPYEVAQWHQDICRPRATLAHPDGHTVFMAGFAGYGRVGGGLGIYDFETGQATLITHEDLIPYHSTIALAALADGTVVGGTTVGAPGGGHVVATEAVLYLFDSATRKVTFQTSPVPGDTSIAALTVAPNGLVYGLASGPALFVFDPAKREVIHTQKLADWGGVPRDSLLVGPNGDVYAQLSKAIVRFDPATYEPSVVATPPVTINVGGPLVNGRLYFGSSSHIWSYKLGE